MKLTNSEFIVLIIDKSIDVTVNKKVECLCEVSQ